MHDLVQRDRSQFLDEMVTFSGRGGWLSYGVERLVVSVVGGNLDDPAYDTIMEASLSFLRSRRIPGGHLTGYERRYWETRHPNDPW
jgi:hypothetical protein